MPYITRDDGEHFIIPSYRDVIAAKNKAILKKDILSLSQNYGEYITMQRKGPQQYEVAFSPDTGYLLGESAWHHFDKPNDLIYCEAIPNTSEAILVIVKDNSVYLDGSFPLDSIPEELVIFLTQKNNFDIYVYGDVPITEHPEDGKFSFDEASVNSFNYLDNPVFNSLPLVKKYRFALVEPVLKEHGIGTPNYTPVIAIVIALVAGYVGYQMFLVKPPPPVVEIEPNPFEGYISALKSPDPGDEINAMVVKVKQFNSIPGWKVNNAMYSKNGIGAYVLSLGSNVEELMDWAKENKAVVKIDPKGIMLISGTNLKSRSMMREVYPAKEIIARLIDRLSKIIPGNVMSLKQAQEKGVYIVVPMDIKLENTSFMVVGMIAEALRGLPIKLDEVKFESKENNINVSISFEVLGR